MIPKSYSLLILLAKLLSPVLLVLIRMLKVVSASLATVLAIRALALRISASNATKGILESTKALVVSPLVQSECMEILRNKFAS